MNSKSANNLTPAELVKKLRAWSLPRTVSGELMLAAAKLIEQQERDARIAADALKTKEQLNEALRNQLDSLKAQLAERQEHREGQQ